MPSRIGKSAGARVRGICLRRGVLGAGAAGTVASGPAAGTAAPGVGAALPARARVREEESSASATIENGSRVACFKP